MEEFVSVGKIGKAHGLKGEMKCLIEDAYLQDIKKAEVFFLEQNGQKIPYFIISLRIGNATILALEEVESKEIASQLRGGEIYMRSSDLLPIENRNFGGLQYSKYEGFRLLDKEFGEIGVIEEILEMPQQEMAVVQYKGQEILIPMNEEYILEAIDSEQLIKIELPEGFLELF